MDDGLYALLNPEVPPDERERAQAALAALQRQKRGSMALGMVGGAPAIQTMGRAAFQDAEGAEKLAAQYGPEQRALKMTLGIMGLRGKEVAADASRYGADARLQGTLAGADARRYAADQGLAGRRYAADRGAQSRLDVANLTGGDKALTQGALAFDKAIDPYKNAGLKPLRESADRALAVRALVENPNGTMQNLTKPQMVDLAMGLTRLITGSSRVTQQMINDLVPHTWKTEASSIGEWILNHPQVLDQQEFAGILHQAVLREEGMARKRMAEVIKQGVSAHAPFLQRAPALAARMLHDRGLDPEDFADLFGGDNGLNIGTAPVAAPSNPEVAAAPRQYARPAAAGTIEYERGPDGKLRRKGAAK